MQLNLNDPESIVTWWKVFPDQHQNFLDYKLKASPEFGPPILEALRRIDDDPALRSLRSKPIQHMPRAGEFLVNPDANFAANEALHGTRAVA